MNKKVLVIDDDPELGELIEAILKPLELTVHQAYSGEDGLKQAYMLHPDLVILDIMMPGLSGFEVCSRLREFSSFPIMMLTARTNENDMLHGFKVGADDFLRKPFSKPELEARVGALLRRSNNQKPGDSYITAYTDSVLEIDLSSKTVKLLGHIVELSPKEYSLLACLVREQGKIVSHRELLREAWGELYLNHATISSLYIYYLRNKLKDGQHGHQYIHTHWGRGYWFEPRNSGEIS
ncbi:MAG: response regulator transcription factor [Anaerolineales bacterium]|nr:response regulator transcription factor [Anaerolineales bacterium]